MTFPNIAPWILDSRESVAASLWLYRFDFSLCINLYIFLLPTPSYSCKFISFY